MKPSYDLWYRELASPTPEARRADRPTDRLYINGFWRMDGARTKPSWPVAIWTDVEKDGEAKTDTIFQIGRKVQNTFEHPAEWAEFTENGWLKCVAVSESDWHQALGTGYWPSDNKPARQMTEEEKLGVEVQTGGNNAPVEELLADQISGLAELLEKTAEPASNEDASLLAGRLDKMRLLLKKADDARVVEKEPYLQGGREVDARWKAVAQPGDTAYAAATARQKAWLRKEQARIVAEGLAERKRLQDEADRQRQEIVDAEKAKGVPEAVAEASAPVIEVAPVEAPRATASSAFGRASGLRKVKRGHIDNMAEFVTALAEIKHPELLTLAQKLADRAAKAGVPIKGMTIKEELE